MSRLQTILRHAVGAFARAVLSVVVWTTWLALIVLLGFQVYIATISRVEIPEWLLHRVEQRLQLSGLEAKFGRASLDPTGTLFFENVSVVLPSFKEPVLTAAGILVRLDPWALVTRRFEPSEIRVTQASSLVPAMLSPTGQTAPLVRDFDLVLRPRGGGELLIEGLSAHLGRLSLNARGSLYLPEPDQKSGSAQATAELIAGRYAAACRQLLAVTEKLEGFEEPSVEVILTPSESRAAIANVTLTARSLKLENPLSLTGTSLQALAHFPLFGEAPVMVRFEFTADALLLPRGAQVRGARAALRGSLIPARFAFTPTDVELTADQVNAEGVVATSFAGRFTTGPFTRLHAEVITQAMGAPLAIVTDADFAAKTAAVTFNGAVAPGWLDLVSSRVGRDVRRFVDFKTPVLVRQAEAVFSAGWKFERLVAQVDVPAVDAYHVSIDEAHGRVELTPDRFYAPEAYARLGKNFARGSYEHRFSNQDFRFLLEGQLQPLDISGWFGPWWPNFFKDFQFPAGPPGASVDVTGSWKQGFRTSVFVYADVKNPVIRGTSLDHARTLLFIRPGFYDGMETLGSVGAGTARGTFTYQLDPATFIWKKFDFDGVSSIDLAVAESLIGPISKEWLQPFKFEQPPALTLNGRLEHSGDDEYHQQLRIVGRSPGPFRFQDFPLERVSFIALLHDDEILLENVDAGFAGGVTKGRAKIFGKGATRKLNFDLSLQEASLGRAIQILEEFAARKNGAPLPAPGKFIQEKNNVRLDLAASAEGNFTDPLSYQGRGIAELKGVELGEVRLLGGLSEALRFTALRFTAANANFRIEGPKLVFPEASLTGDNSAIQGHGEYALDRKQLDFYAKVYPFQESGFILKKLLDMALSPLSNVFEVKLTGTLDKPSWALVLGPTNFLRNLTQSNREEAPPKPTEAGGTPPAPGSSSPAEPAPTKP